MLKYVIFSFFFLCKVYAQNIDYKYFRPSLVQSYIPFHDPAISSAFDGLSSRNVSSKIDLLGISFNKFPDVMFPVKPKDRYFKKSKTAKNENIEFQKKLEISLEEPLHNLTRQIISTWFSRDSYGYMSGAALKERGLYTASQQDLTISGLSSVSRLDDIGYDLISKTYINIYTVNSLKTTKELYDDDDKFAKEVAQLTGSVYLPVIRYSSGFVLDYSALVLKLRWDETTKSNFFENFYVDGNFNKNEDSLSQLKEKQRKAKNFNNLNVGADLISVYQLESSSKERTNPKYETSQNKYYNEKLSKFAPASVKSTIDKYANANVKTTAPTIDYEKFGDGAISDNYIGAALDFYTKARKEALIAKKNTEVLDSKIIQTKIKLAAIYSQFENEFFQNKSKTDSLKILFTPTMNSKIAKSMMNDEKLSSDFKISTTVIGNTYTMLKVGVGTKEDIKVGQRFCAYELVKENGTETKHLVGYARVTKKMVQNSGMISGVVKPKRLDEPFVPYASGFSLFSQQSGEITPGTILELELDKKRRFLFESNLGLLRNSVGKQFFNTYSFGYGFDTRFFWKLFGGSAQMGPENLYMNFLYSFSVGKKNNLGGFAIGFEKEIYTGFQGLHLIPSIYMGDPYLTRFGIGAGYNLGKNLTFSFHKYFGSPMDGGSSFGIGFKFHY